MFNGAATAKGALVITPSKVIVTTPGAENKKKFNRKDTHKFHSNFKKITFKL